MESGIPTIIYNYTWSNGQTGNVDDDLTAGTGTVTISQDSLFVSYSFRNGFSACMSGNFPLRFLRKLYLLVLE